MSTCFGGTAPYNCPPTHCPGCTVIHGGGKAQLCPVCSGSGQIAYHDANSTAVSLAKTCHGCGGKGWVSL